MFLFLTIWPISWSSLLPYIWGGNVICFPHRGKNERKRCSFHKKSCCFDCPHKRSANRRQAQRKNIYNQNKRHHPSLEGSKEFERCSWTCIQLVFGILVWLCTSGLSHLLFVGVHCHSETFFFCVASSCRQLLRMMGSGWASVLKTQSSSGRRSSSENSKYRYLRKHKIIHLFQIKNVVSTHKMSCNNHGFLGTCEPPKLCINEGQASWSPSRGRQQYKKKPCLANI